MKKAPERVRGLPHFLAGNVHKSGGDGACLLVCDLSFGAKPIFLFVAVLPASFLIEFVRAAADLAFEFELL
jgi:hypothetical protein